MNIYRCPQCNITVKRDSNKKWIMSVCSKVGQKVRLQILNQNKDE